MIAIDWGSSSLRLYRLDRSGRIIDQRRSDQGALACVGRFGEVLATHLQGWNDELVLMCGMVGARGGWQEVPYVDCPAGLDTLAAGLVQLLPEDGDALAGRHLWCAPGVADHDRATSDVMRGEETQIAGLLAQLGEGEHRICLPGTHSKWVLVRDGRIARVATAMTGELYALLRGHSILGRTMSGPDEAFDPAAFDAGLARGQDDDGLAHQLFGVRTAALFERFTAPALPSHLSGLLIGHELAHALDGGSGPVHLLGGNALLDRYAYALARLRVPTLRHREDLAAHGLHALAQARGLL